MSKKQKEKGSSWLFVVSSSLLFLLLLFSLSLLLFLVLFSSSDVFVLLGILGGLRDCVWVFDNGFSHGGFWVYFNGYLLLILGIFLCFLGGLFVGVLGLILGKKIKKMEKRWGRGRGNFWRGWELSSIWGCLLILWKRF